MEGRSKPGQQGDACSIAFVFNIYQVKSVFLRVPNQKTHGG
jgi:hypothetical protein